MNDSPFLDIERCKYKDYFFKIKSIARQFIEKSIVDQYVDSLKTNKDILEDICFHVECRKQLCTLHESGRTSTKLHLTNDFDWKLLKIIDESKNWNFGFEFQKIIEEIQMIPEFNYAALHIWGADCLIENIINTDNINVIMLLDDQINKGCFLIFDNAVVDLKETPIFIFNGKYKYSIHNLTGSEIMSLVLRIHIKDWQDE